MNVYVAAKWEDKDRARDIMYSVCYAGHTITHDWTINSVFGVTAAAADVNGVIAADALVAVVEREFQWKGMWVEMGIAIGYGKPIYMLGNWGTDCIFTTLPSVHRVGSIKELIEALDKKSKEQPHAYTPI